jgi:hypothetical protein
VICANRLAATSRILPAFVALFIALPAAGDKIRNPVAVFSGLDKITGRITSFDVAMGETAQFGALQVTPRVCYTRPVTETQNTTSFTEVNEVTLKGEAIAEEFQQLVERYVRDHYGAGGRMRREPAPQRKAIPIKAAQ